MAAFAVDQVVVSAIQEYTPEQAKAQNAYMERKMVAGFRTLPEPGQSGALQSKVQFMRQSRLAASKHFLKKLVRGFDQAVETPCSNSTFFKKVRIESEQKLGQAALAFFLESQNKQIHADPDAQIGHFLELFGGSSKAGDSTSAKSSEFWENFLKSRQARKVLNSTSYLHTHAHHANGITSRFILRFGRLAGEMGHVVLAPTTLFAKIYRHTVEQVNSSSGVFRVALFSAAALTTLALLTVYGNIDNILPLSLLVLGPLYSIGMLSCQIGKIFDAFGYHAPVFRGGREKQKAQIREVAENRLMEQLVNLAKAQNHFSKLGSDKAHFVETAKRYCQNQTDHKANTLAGVVAKVGRWTSQTSEQSKIYSDARKLGQELLWQPNDGRRTSPNTEENSSSKSSASVKTVLGQIFQKHANGSTRLEAINPLMQNERALAAAKRLLIQNEMRSFFGAVKVFSGPRAKGLVATHARAGDADRIENGVVVDGDHPFPDRCVREHLEHLTFAAFNRARLSIAQMLSLISNTSLARSGKNLRFDKRGTLRREYGTIQGLLHGVARRISIQADTSSKLPFRDCLPAPVRKWIPRMDTARHLQFDFSA